MKTFVTVFISVLGVVLLHSSSSLGARIQLRVVCEVADEMIPDVDCTKYYQCSNFEPILSECGPELYFNPALGYCDYPENVPECIGGTRPPTGNTTDGPGPVTSTMAPGTTVTEDWITISSAHPTEETSGTTSGAISSPGSTSGPSLCPEEGVVSVAYPGNCSLYYLCVNGNPTVMACAEGLLFDDVLGKCNLAEEVNCKDATTAPPTTTAEPTTTEPTTTTVVIPITTESSGGVDCPAQGIVFLPDPTDCKKYYLCADGTAVPQECADGLLFDPELGKCNTASEVECQTKPNCPAEGIVYLPVPGSCTDYLMCISGSPIEMTCADGTEFSPEEGKCVLEENYDCPFRLFSALLNSIDIDDYSIESKEFELF